MTRIAFHSENGPGVGGSDMVMGIIADRLRPDDWHVHTLVRQDYPISKVFHRSQPVLIGNEATTNSSQPQPVAETTVATATSICRTPTKWTKSVVLGLVPPIARRWLGYRRCANRVRDVLREHHIDIFQTMDAGPQPTVLGGRLAECGVIAAYNAPPPSGPVNWLTRRLARQSFAAADVRVCVSKHSARAWAEFLGLDPAGFRLIYNGIDLDDCVGTDPLQIRAELGIPPGAVVVGMTGRMSAEKGPTVFARSAVIIAAAHPETLFVFTGDGDQLPTVEQIFREAGLINRVRLLGFRADAPRVAAAYDVAIVPSIFPEPFGLVVIEAMAWAKPVIGSRIGGIPEIVVDGQTGTLVEPNDSAALARALSDLLAAPARRIAMGQAGLERVREHFSRKRMVAAYVEVYRELLARRNPALR